MEEPSFLIGGMNARMALTWTKCSWATLPQAAVGMAAVLGSTHKKTGPSFLAVPA